MKLSELWHRIWSAANTYKVISTEVISDFIVNIITAYIDSNLALRSSDSSKFDDTEEENFDKMERTKYDEDLDWFSRLMRTKMDFSISFLLSRIDQLYPQWKI